MAETFPIVVPVRYSGGGLTMQSTSSRLGAEEIFVRGVVMPKEGAALAIRLTLPNLPEPIDARGTVAARVLPNVKGKEAGVWVGVEQRGAEVRAAIYQVLPA